MNIKAFPNSVSITFKNYCFKVTIAFVECQEFLNKNIDDSEQLIIIVSEETF